MDLSRLDTHASPAWVDVSTLGLATDGAKEPLARANDYLAFLASANLTTKEIGDDESTPRLTSRDSTTKT
ncbi:unnamed protein product [Prunus armeniaca]